MAGRGLIWFVALRTTVVSLLVIVVSCAKHEPRRTYPLSGYVLKLDPNTNLASIHANKIEGWMAEMTMEYPVESRNEYLSFHKDEQITATVNVTSEGFWLTNVKEQK